MGFREDLEKRLERKRSEINNLTVKLREAEIYAQALEDTLKLLPNGENSASADVQQETAVREGSTISRAREVLQKGGKPMHINDLLVAIGRPVDKDNRAALAGSLGAYVRRGEIFTRPGPNIFGLATMRPEENRAGSADENLRFDDSESGTAEQTPDPDCPF